MDEIRDAIAGRHLLELHYKGGLRRVEPHVLGTSAGKQEVMAWQVGGFSRSGGLPEWRRFVLDDVFRPRVLEETFTPRHPVPLGRLGPWDEVELVVDGDPGPEGTDERG